MPNHAVELALKGTGYDDMHALWKKAASVAVTAWSALSTAFVCLFKQEHHSWSSAPAEWRALHWRGGAAEWQGGRDSPQRHREAPVQHRTGGGHWNEFADCDGRAGHQHDGNKGNGAGAGYERMKELKNYEPYMRDLMKNCVQIDYFSNGKFTKVNTAYLRSRNMTIRRPEPGSIIHMPLRRSVVAFNRQPTLGPNSMQAHRVKYVDKEIFRCTCR